MAFRCPREVKAAGRIQQSTKQLLRQHTAGPVRTAAEDAQAVAQWVLEPMFEDETNCVEAHRLVRRASGLLRAARRFATQPPRIRRWPPR